MFSIPALVAAVPKQGICRLVDAIPFFNDAGARSSISDEDINVLTDFARFMNQKVPQMLEEFALLKQEGRSFDVEEFCDMTGRGLGEFSEQETENSHSAFDTILDRYRVKDTRSPVYHKQYFKAVMNFNSNNV